MRALIVDDERLARGELKRLLKVFPEVTVVGEARHADEALEMIEELRPDLLFLDIQMPGQNGFEVLESLDHLPIVIFTTAFDEYALKAFEVNALDYLLKPIEPKRLGAALSKAFEKRLKNSPPQEQYPLGEDSHVFVKEGERCWFVKLGQVRLLESEGNYTRLYFDNHKPLIARSLNYLVARLDPTIFFRACRKHIINLRWVEALEQGFDGNLIVKLKGAPEVKMSRRQSQKFKEMTSM
jgi:two-component system, LytTR family, response regulator